MKLFNTWKNRIKKKDLDLDEQKLKLEQEIEEIERRYQSVCLKRKKCWHRTWVAFGVLFFTIVFGLFFVNNFQQKELKKYQQELDAKTNEVLSQFEDQEEMFQKQLEKWGH